MFSALSAPHAALLLFIVGALCVYGEFLRPGWVLPGAVGAALLILSLARLGNCHLNPWGYVFFMLAAGMFLLGARYPLQRVVIGVGGVCLVVSFVLLIGLLVGLSSGVPFAVLTSYLVAVAVRARRNKTAQPG